MSRVSAVVLASLVIAGCGKDETPPLTPSDDTAPVITLNGEAQTTTEVGEGFEDPGASATDDTDGSVAVAVSGSVDTTALGSYTLTYAATDAAGNSATATRTVEVADTTPPVIELAGDVELMVIEGGTFEDLGATATDRHDGHVQVMVSGSVDTSTVGTYTLTYDAIDSSGNRATSVIRTVNVDYLGQLAVVSDGLDVILIGVDADGSISERSRLDLEAVFDTAPYPRKVQAIERGPDADSLYVLTSYDCDELFDEDDDGWFDEGQPCSGGMRVDRLSVSKEALSWQGLAYAPTPPITVEEVSFDAGSGQFSAELTNRSGISYTLDHAYPGRLWPDIEFSSECEGVTLAPGVSCSISGSGFSYNTASANLILETADWSTHVEFYRQMDDTLFTHVDGLYWEEGHVRDAPRCASAGTWERVDGLKVANPTQCSPTSLTISADGTRAYLGDDWWGSATMLDIESDGTFSFISESNGASIFGGALAVNAAGTALFCSGRRMAFDGEKMWTATSYDGSARDAHVRWQDGKEVLFSLYRRTAIAWHWGDPGFDELDRMELGGSSEIWLDVDATGGTVAALDAESLWLASFDGASFGTPVTRDATLAPIACGDGCSIQPVWRGVRLSDDADLVIATGDASLQGFGAKAETEWQGIVKTWRVDPETLVATPAAEWTFDGFGRDVVLITL